MGTCLRHARGTGQARSLGRLQAPITWPCARAIRDSNNVVPRGLAFGVPTAVPRASVTPIPASFYLADSLCVAAKTRLAA